MDHERVLCVDCLMKNCEEECKGRSVCLCASVYVCVCVCVWVCVCVCVGAQDICGEE